MKKTVKIDMKAHNGRSKTETEHHTKNTKRGATREKVSHFIIFKIFFNFRSESMRNLPNLR